MFTCVVTPVLRLDGIGILGAFKIRSTGKMQDMTTTLLDSSVILENADSVEFQPFPSGDRNLLLSCSYQFEEQLNRRIGNLTLFSVVESRLDVVDTFADKTCGYLDSKWIDGSKVATACSNGEVKIFEIRERNGQTDAKSLVNESCVQVDADKKPILLSLDFFGESFSTPLTICSSDKGCVHNVDLNCELVTEIGRHSCEVWTCAFDKNTPNMVLSGGDDCVMNIFDIRLQRKVKSVDHPSGVCCVQTDVRHPNLIVTGCYDDHIRLFDYRFMESEHSECLSKDVNTSGGPWRLKFSPDDKNLMGVAAMYEGYKTLQLPDCRLSKAFSNPEEANLLAYGFDWSRNQTHMFATCSFYDKIISLWKIHISK